MISVTQADVERLAAQIAAGEHTETEPVVDEMVEHRRNQALYYALQLPKEVNDLTAEGLVNAAILIEAYLKDGK